MTARRLALVVLLLGLFAAPGAQAATVVVGDTSLVPDPLSTADFIGQNIPVFQGDASGHYTVAATQTGYITSWSFLSAGVATGKQFVLRVLAPIDAAGTNLRAVATIGPVAVTSATGVDAVNGPFPGDSTPIAAGSRIALQPVDDGNTPIEPGVAGVDGIRFFATPFAAEGSSQTVATTEDNGQVVPIQATIEYGEPAPPPLPAPTNTVAPSISGTASAGQTLTCNPGSWSGNPNLSYLWTQTTSQLVPGAHPPRATSVTVKVGTEPTYVVPDLEPLSVSIKCTVTATNSAGSASADAPAVANVATKPVLASSFTRTAHTLHNQPRITPNVGFGATQFCQTGVWIHYPKTFRFAWYKMVPANTVRRGQTRDVRIPSSKQTLKITAPLELHKIFCRVTAVNEAGGNSADSNVVFVPQNAPKPNGPARIEVDDPTPVRVDPATSPSNPLQVGPDKKFVFKCLPPGYSRRAPLSFQWQVSLHGWPSVPGVPSSGAFNPEVTLSGQTLEITPEIPPHQDANGLEPGRALLLDGEMPYTGSGGSGNVAIRCLVTAKLLQASSVTSSTVAYVLAVDG
ncbi:MAG: hypothetical protein JST59_22420 [Actinobacteria bacterium]|nr:hypothetical protein [Actinomycetota bacterium]